MFRDEDENRFVVVTIINVISIYNSEPLLTSLRSVSKNESKCTPLSNSSTIRTAMVLTANCSWVS